MPYVEGIVCIWQSSESKDIMSLTTDRNDPDLHVQRPDGQNVKYLVLSEEERAKGFVRPLRRTYIHVGRRPPSNLRPLTEEEKERYSQYGYVAYEEGDDPDSCVRGRFWTQEELEALANICNARTTMSYELAATYARDPKFYGATFCCECGKHFRVSEFVWEDGTVVGS